MALPRTRSENIHGTHALFHKPKMKRALEYALARTNADSHTSVSFNHLCTAMSYGIISSAVDDGHIHHRLNYIERKHSIGAAFVWHCTPLAKVKYEDLVMWWVRFDKFLHQALKSQYHYLTHSVYFPQGGATQSSASTN